MDKGSKIENQRKLKIQNNREFWMLGKSLKIAKYEMWNVKPVVRAKKGCP